MVLKVEEIFRSVQGEGELIGVPHTFIRLAGCNLRCRWCDTKYSWKHPGRGMSEMEILERIETEHVCITGGEPLLQDIYKLCGMLHEKGLFVTIETNCTRFEERLKGIVGLFSVSPKLPSSGEKYSKTVLRKYIKAYPKTRVTLKFVVKTEDDLEELFKIIKNKEIRAKKIPVVLQPEGYCSLNEYRKRLRKLIERVVFDEKTRRRLSGVNYRILPQLHRVAWDRKGGV